MEKGKFLLIRVALIAILELTGFKLGTFRL
jgi:hypothetical protein